jgi:hypothetical protein
MARGELLKGDPLVGQVKGPLVLSLGPLGPLGFGAIGFECAPKVVDLRSCD